MASRHELTGYLPSTVAEEVNRLTRGATDDVG
jgi:hypothetical protein